jgi:hypothetical protein
MALTSGTTTGDNKRYIPVLATLSAGGVLYFFVVVLLLHLLSPEFDPRTRFISEYAHSPYGYLLTSAFFALGLGSICLVAALLKMESSQGVRRKAGLALLAVWSIGVIIDGIFPIDPGVEPVTTAGTIHLMAAMIAFISLMVASLLLSLGFRQIDYFRKMSRSALVLVSLIFLSFIIGNIPDPATQGLTQRLFVLFCLGWLLFISLNVRSSTKRG